jgi:hypothetical protein
VIFLSLITVGNTLFVACMNCSVVAELFVFILHAACTLGCPWNVSICMLLSFSLFLVQSYSVGFNVQDAEKTLNIWKIKEVTFAPSFCEEFQVFLQTCR